MSSLISIVRAASRRAPALAILIVLWLPAPGALAEDFEVRTASLGSADGFWRLSARIDYRLTDEAVAALENGVTLTFRVDVEIARVRRWLPDAEVLSVSPAWHLSFEPLSTRYLVRYPDEREPSSHATLFGALNAIGRVQGLPIAEESRLDRSEPYNLAVRAVLSQQTLPAPLQFLAFWNGGFSLESDWYEWTLAP
jgi:hypothetical protein